MKIDLVTNKHKLFNPLFYKVKAAKTRFVINYGGSGSGKSYSQHQWELLYLMTSNYDTLVIRKYSVDIKDSCYKLFRQVANAFQIAHLFKWTYSNANREITYIETGKKIVFKGVDDPEKLKSLAGFQRIMIEEASQLNIADFMEINRRVRGVKNIQIVLLFNPIHEEHWIKKHFFDTEKVRNETTIFHTTYLNNKFLTEQDKEQLELLSEINPNDYRIYALGEWGKPNVQRPWLHNFNRDRHVSNEAVMQLNKQVYFSMDFNIDPFMCVAGHIWQDAKGYHAHFFREFKLTSGNHQEMADRIKSSFSQSQLANAAFTGDATGKSRRLAERDNISHWQSMQKYLSISAQRLQIPKFNPKVVNNRADINYLFSQIDIRFNPEMKTTINELQYTEADAEGNILKKDRNKEEQRADCLDCVRYFCNTWLQDVIKKGNIRGKVA